MDAGKKWRLFRLFFTFIILFLCWFLFSGSGDLYSFFVGFAGALIMASLSYDVFIEEFEAGRRSVIPRFFPALIFGFQLIIAMYASSFRVLGALFHRKLNPRVVHFRSRLHSDLARVVLAQSITFTPGTVTLELDDDHYIVHWLFATTRHSGRAGEEVKGGLEKSIRRIWS
ncbi:Na+/H+ antiporter subunit E [Breznakiella homolactica]|uniref:Na+/H+ antiporter subunit E n=1 Tax=Breznakiella homolactica TaxID=2798577 RepID=A0A7T7XR68_9SPIR|nr:Na+/H+ antiporter subunit E [Breznakiella homolactica]QQO10992.1 Na+/H+ antiporter subunit E [Breznakiella homolactica]